MADAVAAQARLEGGDGNVEGPCEQYGDLSIGGFSMPN
jgi:hypothetical protein